MRQTLFFLLILSISLPCFVLAQDTKLNNDQEKRLQLLEDLVKQQQNRIDELEDQLGESEESTREYTEKLVKEYLSQESIQEDFGVSAGYDRGFFIRSADGNFELKMTGYIQFGVGFFENDTKDNNSFFVNGMFLTFDMFFYQQWWVRLQFDLVGVFGGNDGFFQNGNKFEPEVRDAFIQYTGIPEFNVRAGNTHVPFTIEGQYGQHQRFSIFAEPFILSWGHGRDPGFMLLGTMRDVLEYKLSVHNGEGQAKINQTDQFLFAGQMRFFYLKKSVNNKSFLHAGFLRANDNNLKENGAFGSASIKTPWGRRLFGDANVANDDGAQGWRTAFDVGGTYRVGPWRIEGEYMYSEWERSQAAGLRRLYGHGGYLGVAYKHNLTGEDDGSGLIGLVKFSYTDLDDSNGGGATQGIEGQTVLVYTAGLGYAFNRHIAINTNWILVDTDRSDVNSPKNDNGVDGTEQGWFVQVTAIW